MKNMTSKIVCGVSAAALAFAAVSFSCSRVKVEGSADTVYAETKSAVAIPSESLKVIEALQNSFNSISEGVLPSVVEIDVTEKTTVTQMNPFEDLPFWFLEIQTVITTKRAEPANTNRKDLVQA